MGAHLVEGTFQSDKYPTCPLGKVPLSCKDPTAQDLLWEYAQRRRSVDAEFADDLEQALRNAGFVPGERPRRLAEEMVYEVFDLARSMAESKDDGEYAQRLADRFSGSTGETWFMEGYKRAIFLAMQCARRDERLRMREERSAVSEEEE